MHVEYIDYKFDLYNKNKLTSLELINEIYDDNNLFNKIRNYIINYCSLTSKIKMIRRTL